jgi:uncharacterized membrane protein
MIPYAWTAVGVIGIAAAAGALIAWRSRAPLLSGLSTRQALAAVTCLAALHFLVYTWLSLWRYENLYLGLWDLGILDSIVRGMARFESFLWDLRGGPFDHFSPAMALFAPLYWIADDPTTLLTAQAFLLAAAALPLFGAARIWLGDSGRAALVAALYLLNPYLSRLAFHDAHVEALFPLVFFLACYAWATGR